MLEQGGGRRGEGGNDGQIHDFPKIGGGGLQLYTHNGYVYRINISSTVLNFIRD